MHSRFSSPSAEVHVMLVNEEDGRFYVADSTLSGAGNGLFTKVPIRKGDRPEVIGVMCAVTRLLTAARTSLTQDGSIICSLTCP